MKHIALLFLAVTTGLAVAADPVPPMPSPAPPGKATPKIKFPEFAPPAPKVVTPPVPVVPPMVDPDAPVKLAKGQFYVVASPEPLLVLTEGQGEVVVVDRKPPFMLPAEQAIGWKPDPKDPEFVTWGAEYPHLYVVKPVKSGDVKLIVVPATSKIDAATKLAIPIAKKDVQYKALEVDDGTGPRPPPKPDVIPEPKPKPDVVPDGSQDLRVVFVYADEKLRTKEQLNIMNSTKLVEYLNKNCVKGSDSLPSWRKWDWSIVSKPDGLKYEIPVMQQLWSDVKAKVTLDDLPQVVIVVGQKATPYAWVGTEQGMIDFIKEKSGKK